ncbi:uncharacterized protein C8Q71DRAFT_560160 [Rhodofomes roseus]|uniref:Uncharacterized protein n=1 Tax=Rhodofomes roseus TaxID=34475 RepID=A0A4Y9YS90_9APHY|nr:uncharacterized protein C8Q71DRAFT_560160 [Rhodofomes roseus]KAH9837764.1 hypothetical protein C8Q71DRAFT_560160 [Rhodofomes roseus]TFY64557.1 hypothetical protein EVJ58_g2538 [Rhodofomes roseus]
MNAALPESVTLEQLQTVNDELRRKKLDAEKDRDLFRDMYSKASAHASEVTKENNELLERAELAEGQVKDGLRMIKGTYEERIRLLEAEVEKWKGQAQLLTARDRRTLENEEFRRRAAMEPELRGENERLKEELQKLQEDYAKLEVLLAQIGEQELDDSAPPTPMLEVPGRPMPRIVRTSTTSVQVLT